MAPHLAVFAALVAIPSAGALRFAADEDAAANPIRRVVGLLQTMAGKISKEGETEKELYEKFQCYCKNGASDLSVAITDSTAKVPGVQSDIEESQASSAKLKQDLKKHETSRSAAKAAMADATEMREKEHAAYVAESTELKGYTKSLGGAIPAIQNGMAGTGLLQTHAYMVAQLRRAIARDERITDDDKDSVIAFLAGSTQGTDQRYVPAGGEIVGILKDMKEGFDKDLAGVEQTEAEALAVYDETIGAKTKEVKTLTATIEKKIARVGELDLSVVRMKQELTAAEAALIENKKFLADLDSDCATKTKDFEERVKTRGQELAAIHDTIKILNDDDALDLFKKTLPSPSFVQVDNHKKEAQQQAVLVLKKATQAASQNVGADVRFLELALMGEKADFSKVFKMIDDMVNILKTEQVDDDSKKEYCHMQIGMTKDKAKTLTGTISDIEVNIEEKTGTIATLKEDLKTLNAGIAELDKLVAEATQQRKDENQEFTQLMSSDSAAKDLLAFAKNRLQKFYNPTLYKAPPKAKAAAFLQIADAHHTGRQAPGSAPDTWKGGYKKQGEDSNGVLGMIDTLAGDLDKEMWEAKTQEERGQKAYEKLMSDSAEKRAKDVKTIQEKQSAIADSEEILTAGKGDLKAKKTELMTVESYMLQLHTECDFLMQNYDLRKSARAEEMDALKQAKATLAGADYSLAQAPLRGRKRSL